MKPRFKTYDKVKRNCLFCKAPKEPDCKDTETLNKFVSERGKLLARSKTGLCQKHQKRVTKAVKRARFLALLPYIVRP